MIARGETGSGSKPAVPVRAVMLGLVVAAALVGCSDDDPPSSVVTTTVSAPTSSTAPSPSVSPSPTLPAAALQATRPGAEAFARYFFEVFSYSLWVRDSTSLRHISDSRCVYCSSIVNAVDAMEREQKRAEGGSIDVKAAVAAPITSADRVIVTLVLDQEPGRTLSSDGRVLGTTAGRKGQRADIAVGWVAGRWIMLNVHLVKPGES